MKKGVSILFAIVILLSGAQFSIATHFCGGRVVETIVSLSGKLASCGMEGTEESCPVPGHHLKTHCCDDVVTLCSIDNNYAPSFSVLPESYKSYLQVFGMPVSSTIHSAEVLKSLYTNESPPADLLSTNVDLSDICVFRI